MPNQVALAEEEGSDKFYLSHLNYAGRGNTRVPVLPYRGKGVTWVRAG